MEQGVDIQHKQTKDRHNSMGKIVTFRNDRKEERKDKKNRQWIRSKDRSQRSKKQRKNANNSKGSTLLMHILIAKQLVMIGIFQNDNFKVFCSPKAFFHSSIDVRDNESTRNIGDKNEAAHEKCMNQTFSNQKSEQTENKQIVRKY